MLHNRFTLGLVAAGRRAIRSGAEYNKYFNLGSVEGEEITLLNDGSVSDTVEQMKKIVRTTLPQTKKIASVLKGSTREATARNLWDFLYNHVQYTKDNPLREQLRTPARTWQDRARGVDCDCYSIFISSVLTNLGIPHFFRIAAYNGGDFQHVYVVVPDSGKQIIIDPVVDRFNSEHPYSDKKDFNMKVTMLNGVALGACAPATTATPAGAATATATTPAKQPEPVEFRPLDFFIDHPEVQLQTAATPAPTEQRTTNNEQPVKHEAGTGVTSEKVMWGLGLSAAALLLISAFKPKPNLSGPPTRVRKRLSVVQL